MRTVKHIILLIALALLFTGCKFSSITSATPDPDDTIIMEPGATQAFAVTVDPGDFQRIQDAWIVSDENTEGTQKIPESYLFEYTPDQESPGLHHVTYMITDYYFKMYVQNFLGVMLPVNRSWRTWDVIVKGIEVLPERNMSAVVGNSLTYTATAYPTGTYDYTWFLDNVQVATGTEYTFTPTAALCGLHTLQVTATGSGGDYTYSRQLIVPVAELKTYDTYTLFYDFAPCNDGGYVFADTVSSTGQIDLTGYGSIDGYIYKLGMDGTVDWRILCGGDGWDQLYSVDPTTDGGCIAAGWSQSTVIGTTNHSTGTDDIGNPLNEPYIVKLNSAGNIDWQKLIATPSSSSALKVIRQTSDGGFIAGGYCWVVKLDASGGVVWERTLDATSYCGLYEIIENADSYILAGSGMVCKLNKADGSTLWRTDSISSCITAGADGGYVKAYTDDTTGSIRAVKLGEDGTVMWQKTYSDDTGSLQIASLASYAGTGYVLAGWHLSNTSDVTSNSVSDSKVLVMVLDKDGNVTKRIVFGEKNQSTYDILMKPMPDGRYAVFFETYDCDIEDYRFFLVPMDVNND